jgi:acyl carrier protein
MRNKMNKNEVLLQIQAILRDQLEDEQIQLTETTSAKEVEGRDSLMHLQIIVAIEKHFKITFSSKELFAWKHVEDMADSIIRRLGNAS